MIKEIYRDIIGYEGLYQISNFGNVKSLERITSDGRRIKERFLNFTNTKDGYFRVILCKNKISKAFLVHRLVAQAFIPNTNNLPQINHKDENHINNNVNNLEWCTAKYNSNYGTKIDRGRSTMINTMSNKVNNVYQYDLDYNLIKIWSSCAECGRNGFTTCCVNDCCNNKYGKLKNVYRGYIWSYKPINI